MSQSLYEVLGVSKSAAHTEIKRAYRKLASKNHPDKGGDKEKMQAIQRAYDVLSDDERRQTYDLSGETERRTPLDDMAIQLLAEGFRQFLTKGNASDSALDAMTDAIRRSTAEHELSLANLPAQRARLERKANLVKHADADKNIYAGVLAELLAQLEQSRILNEQRIKICGRALELLAEFEACPEQAIAQMGMFSWSSGSTFGYNVT